MEFSKYLKSFLIGLVVFGFTQFAHSYNYPKINSFDFTKNPIFNVYYNDPPAEIPIYMSYNPGNTGMGQWHYWTVPYGKLQYVSSCDIPLVSGGWRESKLGNCTFKLVLPSNRMNAVYQGAVSYSFGGKSSKGQHHWSPSDTKRTTRQFYVKVIPHPINLDIIPEQEVVAKTLLTINFKNRIRYFDENVLAGDKPIASITAAENGVTLEELGLKFNPETLNISGAANQTGVFHFYLHAKNRARTLEPRPFMIKITENPKDTPIFRENLTLSAVTPNQFYDFNLLSLLKDNATFMASNEVTFTIDTNTQTEENKWLRIENGTHLTGQTNGHLAGREISISIRAHSNTGGESLPAKLKLHIATNPSMKPVIKENLELNSTAGGEIYYNMQNDIIDPTPQKDGSLRVVIDEVKTQCPNSECDTRWLEVLRHQPTILNGMVPLDATGRDYTITVHANNKMGGDSEKRDIKLHVGIDPDRKPGLKVQNPIFPRLQPGQAFFHDFVASRDVYPEYEDAPFTIEFDESAEHPYWLRLEDNKLIVDKVPEDVEGFIFFRIIIKNIPGGASEPVELLLRVNSN